jgi:hypothetical protein
MLKRFPANATTKDRIDFVYRSPELNFLDSNIHDDARQGIATLSELEANSTIMQSMLSELRILFGLNVAVSVIVRPSNAVKSDCCSAVTCCTDSVLCHLSSNRRQRCSTGHCALRRLTFPSFLILNQARMSRIFLSSIPLEALSKVRPFSSNFRFLNVLCYRCNMVNYGHCFFRSLKRSFDLCQFSMSPDIQIR